MVDYQASLQLSRKRSLCCVLSKAQVSQQPLSGRAVLPSGTVDCPKDAQLRHIDLDCFTAVVFFISEIVLFNILNKILRNKW